MIPEGHLRAIGATKGLNHDLLDAVFSSGLATEEEIVKALANHYRLPYVQLSERFIDPPLFTFIPIETARKHHCVPIDRRGNCLTLAMYNPLNLTPAHSLEFEHNLQVKIVLATRTDILNAINKQFGEPGTLDAFMKGVYEEPEDQGEDDDPILSTTRTYKISELEEIVTGESKPIIKLANLILTDAVEAGASDIHVEPLIDNLKIRYRVDGVILEHMTVPKWAETAIVSRLKIIAELDISNRRVPQDGRLNIIYKQRTIDLRVSTLPTHYGEKVVMRILDHARLIPSLDNLGISGDRLDMVKTAFRAPQGLILTTGPTGSGKTSTLYAAVQTLRTGANNITTVEDPIEYRIAGVNQVQVNERSKLTFANALRSILRQDPDIILVGEIRDRETAAVAIQAAQTGHLVLSSLHTNDAASTLRRLAEMGVEPYLIAESTLLVMAQRLVRVNCTECLEPYEPTPQILLNLGVSERKIKFMRGRGCEACRQTGYRGRRGLFELLVMNSKLAQMILNGANSIDIRTAAAAAGMKTIYQDGIARIQEGVTTPEEVLRVIHVDEELKEAKLFCPGCEEIIEQSFSVCPFCSYKLRRQCSTCKADLLPEWARCPHCQMAVASGPEVAMHPGSASAGYMDEIPIQIEDRPIRQGRPEPPRIWTAADEHPITHPATPVSHEKSVASEATAESTVEHQPGGDPVPRYNVLIVDDDIVSCNQTTLLLRDLEYDIFPTVATNGSEALERIRESVPDAIICDLLMPEMDGYEFIEKLRAAPETAKIPIVVITQTNPEKTEWAAMKFGADVYLQKPIDRTKFHAAVTELLVRPLQI